MSFAEIAHFSINRCENCPLNKYCQTDEDTREIAKAISYRDRAVITEQEFEETLGIERVNAVNACEQAKFVLETCMLEKGVKHES